LSAAGTAWPDAFVARVTRFEHLPIRHADATLSFFLHRCFSDAIDVVSMASKYLEIDRFSVRIFRKD